MAAPRKPSLSPTRIATYLECAAKYRFLYVDKIGRFYLRARPHYSFGSTLHQVLQGFHREGGTLSQAALIERYEQSWVSAGYESAEQEAEMRGRGVEIVQAYHAAAGEREAETLYTEKMLKADMGRFFLTGRVDRVDRHADGPLEIVDYKSGRSIVTPEQVAADLAISIYQLLLRKMHPGAPVIGTIYALRTGAQASASMTDEEAARFETDMRVLGEEIIDRDYANVEPLRIEACDDCEFLRRCDRFWRWQSARDPG